MSDTAGISDRHLRPASGLAAVPQSPAQFVRIRVSEVWARSQAGQLLCSSLVNLLCRQIGLISHVQVVSPRVPTSIRMPHGQEVEFFPDCLAEFSTWAVNGLIAVSTSETADQADVTICVGDVPRTASDSPPTLAAIGNGWRAWIGDPDSAPRDMVPTSPNALGPFLAAALAAGEVFKRGRGILRGRYLTADGYSLWGGQHTSDWESLDDGPEIAGHRLAPAHVVGAGAVGNALAYVVAYLGLVDGYFVFVDDDTYDRKNLNRCLLAGWQDVTHPKVDRLAATLSGAGLGAFPFPGTISRYVAEARIGLRRDVDRDVGNLVFRTVLSCVDKGMSRQDVQGLDAQLLLGASTLDLQAKVNLYPRRRGAACLACFNPAERDGDKLRALQKQLKEMEPAARRDFLLQRSLDVRAVEDWLAGAGCGELGEAALRDFVTRPTEEFSVGFVSLGAGLLLAAALLRQTLFQNSAPTLRDMITLNFLNGGLLDANLGYDEACERRCQEHFGYVEPTLTDAATI